MPESEFRRWQRYADSRAYPARRLEIQVAVVALTLARVMGGNTSVKLDDFLIAPSAQSRDAASKTPDETRSAASVFAGVAGVRRLGRKKQKRKAA